MRNTLFLAIIVAGTSACAARASQSPTIPTEYACGDSIVVRDAGGLKPSPAAKAQRMAWRDDAGEHFVDWPASTGIEATEWVVPSDPRQDAAEHTYDTSNGSSTQDWRLVRRQVCTARGGYNDVLARYLNGDALDEIARDLRLDHDATRALVHDAMLAVQKRYYHDH